LPLFRARRLPASHGLSAASGVVDAQRESAGAGGAGFKGPGDTATSVSGGWFSFADPRPPLGYSAGVVNTSCQEGRAR
jgi:hypothetical protein